ncbi:MAG TPA: DUF3596 domain-containing protein, partial [Pseudomonadales bacterium]|nr:DUF3596 domain-containing protein [Pseudomonadales bacterium]
MANVRVDERTSRLYLDFRYQGKRYREFSGLKNTAANTRKLEKLGVKIEQEIVLGTFKYHDHFPESAAGKRFAQEELEQIKQATAVGAAVASALQSESTNTPLFKDFVEEWIMENKVSWRDSHLTNMHNIVKCHYLPHFADREVGSITRAELLKFRSDLAKVPGRTVNKGLSANRINKIMDPLRRVFEEAADRYEFNTPFIRIKP